MANINFKGIKQVTLSNFNQVADTEKLGYLWLVREPKSQSADDGGKKVDNFSIYFGTRRYAENDVFFHENIVKAFGGLLDAEGAFVFPVDGKSFTSIDESEINDLNGLLLALDKVIKANKDALAEVDGKISTAKTEAIDAASAAITEALKGYVKTGDIKSYTAGTAIDINDENKISAKVVESAEGNKNFLAVEESGLAVRAMDADKTVITEKIPVAGGPLAELLNKAGIKEITPDMSIADVLTAMVAKEEYPTPSNASATITASIAAPVLSGSSANGATVEVGTEFTLNDVVTKVISVSTTPSKVSNLLYGYSAENDNKADSTNKEISKTVATGISDNTYEMAAAVTGFSANGAAVVPATITGDGSAKIEAVKIGAAIEGANKITITEKGAIAKGSADAIESVYVVSNFGKTKEEAKTTPLAAVVDKVSIRPSATASITITGVYKYFMGYSENTTVEQFDSASVRALTALTGNVTANGTTTIVGEAKKVSNGKSIVIACPAKYKLATIDNGLGANIMENFSVTGKVSVKTGVINTDYNVYIYPIINNAEVEFKNVTLVKA